MKYHGELKTARQARQWIEWLELAASCDNQAADAANLLRADWQRVAARPPLAARVGVLAKAAYDTRVYIATGRHAFPPVVGTGRK